jgi:hypothetical protein
MPGKRINRPGSHCSRIQETEKVKTIEKKNYLIVPNSAVLVLVREGFETETSGWDANSN